MHLKNASFLLPLCLLMACSARNETSPGAGRLSAEQVLASADSVSFSSDITDINSASRKIVRTADFRCRVSDVFSATTELERLVKSTGGIVQESRMVNEGNSTQDVYYKPDSLRQVQTYTTTAYLTLRVPAASLDSVTNAIPQLSAFVEQRSLSQSDVTLQYLANALKNKTAIATAKPMELAKKTADAIQAGNYDESRKETRIDRSIENLQLLNNANYATVTVAFFQPERVNSTIIINPDYFTKPTYGMQFMLAISRGWDLLRSMLLVCITIWPLWLLVVLCIVLYKKYKRPAVVKA